MSARIRSIARGARPIVDGPTREGTGLGHGYIDVGGYVLALTPPGAPRMPNGVECEERVVRGDRVRVGGGRIATAAIDDGTLEWDAVPRPRVALRAVADIEIDPLALAGRGPGLTPAGDDLLAGYVAGLVLFHSRRREARGLAAEAAPRTTGLSATLLWHAVDGELPEPAHLLLERGESGPLLGWGHTSGRLLALGLALAFGDRRAQRIRWPRRWGRKVQSPARVA